MTLSQASNLIGYARQMRVARRGERSRPVAWSNIHNSCEQRALALQYIMATTPLTLEDRAPEMREEDLEPDTILTLAQMPSRTVGSISVTGPLITHQKVAFPGSHQGMEVGPISWVYHVAVVANVEGRIQVFDLSMGDQPVPVDVWLRSFTPPDVECKQVDSQAYGAYGAIGVLMTICVPCRRMT